MQQKNIGFANLGNEQCETCLHFSHHEHQPPKLETDCELCQKYTTHKARVASGRSKYDEDREKDPEVGFEMFVSADMQNVMMMPFMRGVKTCVFINRLVAFHETFAPLGQQAEKKNPQQIRSVLWHEQHRGYLPWTPPQLLSKRFVTRLWMPRASPYGVIIVQDRTKIGFCSPQW